MNTEQLVLSKDATINSGERHKKWQVARLYNKEITLRLP